MFSRCLLLPGSLYRRYRLWSSGGPAKRTVVPYRYAERSWHIDVGFKTLLRFSPPSMFFLPFELRSSLMTFSESSDELSLGYLLSGSVCGWGCICTPESTILDTLWYRDFFIVILSVLHLMLWVILINQDVISSALVAHIFLNTVLSRW